MKFLQQQDERQQQQAAEQEKLQRLREVAESQEAKLKKVRALRGHVEQKRLRNGRLGEGPGGTRAGRRLHAGTSELFKGRIPCSVVAFGSRDQNSTALLENVLVVCLFVCFSCEYFLTRSLT